LTLFLFVDVLRWQHSRCLVSFHRSTEPLISFDDASDGLQSAGPASTGLAHRHGTLIGENVDQYLAPGAKSVELFGGTDHDDDDFEKFLRDLGKPSAAK
jgi:hypothetical protein